MRTVAATSARVWRWLASARRRDALIQAAKMTLAAVLAWLVARQIHEPQSFIAPYVAVFLISQTVYRSLLEALRQLAVIVTGVVLAFTVVLVIPNQVAALAVAVFAGMLLGRSPWLREGGIWVGVVALLMVTYRTADDVVFGLYRVLESVIGAGVGAAVNLLILPPIHLRQAERVVADVSTEITDLLRAMSEGVRRSWRDWDTTAWSGWARQVDKTVHRARESVGWAYESTRFNPGWRGRSRSRPSIPAARWAAIDTLDEVARQTQRMTEALGSANLSGAVTWPTDAVFNARFAALLERLIAGVERYRSPDTDPAGPLAEVSHGLEETERMTRELAERSDEVSGWTAQGALLVSAERAFRALAADDGAEAD